MGTFTILNPSSHPRTAGYSPLARAFFDAQIDTQIDTQVDI
jgi:hypothetical protein